MIISGNQLTYSQLQPKDVLIVKHAEDVGCYNVVVWDEIVNVWVLRGCGIGVSRNGCTAG